MGGMGRTERANESRQMNERLAVALLINVNTWRT
jgi:hypothetical protein